MEIKKGDIVLVRLKTFLGRVIQFGMNLQRWRWLGRTHVKAEDKLYCTEFVGLMLKSYKW